MRLDIYHHSDDEEYVDFKYMLMKLYTLGLEIKNKLHKLERQMATNQAEFDAQLNTINEKVTSIFSTVTAEAQQIAEFIANNPSVDTSALSGVAERLSQVESAVADIFTPTAVNPQEETPVSETGSETTEG